MCASPNTYRNGTFGTKRVGVVIEFGRFDICLSSENTEELRFDIESRKMPDLENKNDLPRSFDGSIRKPGLLVGSLRRIRSKKLWPRAVLQVVPFFAASRFFAFLGQERPLGRVTVLPAIRLLAGERSLLDLLR